MITANINVAEPEIFIFCHKWNIQELALFGSVLRDDFGPESDVDVLVTYMRPKERDLAYLWDMREESRQIASFINWFA